MAVEESRVPAGTSGSGSSQPSFFVFLTRTVSVAADSANSRRCYSTKYISIILYIVHTRVLHIIYRVSSPADGAHGRFRGCGRHQGTLYNPRPDIAAVPGSPEQGREPRPDLTHEAIHLFLHAW